MFSDSESAPSTPEIKQEDTDLQPVNTSGRNKAQAAKKKRNLVRWDDDLDKQVLLVLQWSCNEVGIKIPWELVAQTLGRGITEGAIVQHLSKLRGKMIVAKMAVPPPLKRGSVAKEPSKLYATSNGKKLPPPVFKSPSTPLPSKAKKDSSPKTLTTPKPKAASRAKPKRRRSDLDDSDEDEVFNENNGDSDEEYGTARKKARVSKPKAKEAKVSSNKSTISNTKAIQKVGGSDVDEINQDIMAALEEDGGPATRTRHVKQDFTSLEQNFTDEEEDEEEDFDEAGFGELDIPAVYSPAALKQEDSSTPSKAAPYNKIDVANWNQGMAPNMLPLGGAGLAKGYDVVPPYQQANMSSITGLITPQLSRQASTTSYNTSISYTPLATGFGPTAGRGLGQNNFGTQSVDPCGLFSNVNYNGGNEYLPTMNSGMDVGNGTFDVEGSYAPDDLGDGYGYGSPMNDDPMFDQYTMFDGV